MSDKEMNDIVLSTSPEGSIKWVPEDYDFKSPKGMDGVWYYKNLELRTLNHNYWLLRKKITNDRGNTEMLIKWRIQVFPGDKGFADLLFSKGLK